ncbi:hypothetical protein BU25DRAFT_419447 [Macroventuria anomochaeta]|uniref:Uncharacterized protein n=1 Tax=Macroventuria anomochaeta TaxID=301207 RepID=A0ACB6S8V7_9PLEO|nr:uncharacterized protein BU25DRAFT_419447 [Macroventuria anomochaeta]KAF2630468.1 hypothetical protein BU25DRAFT_419447 [Macroventuria anomochaeta]
MASPCTYRHNGASRHQMYFDAELDYNLGAEFDDSFISEYAVAHVAHELLGMKHEHQRSLWVTSCTSSVIPLADSQATSTLAFSATSLPTTRTELLHVVTLPIATSSKYARTSKRHMTLSSMPNPTPSAPKAT